MQTDSIIPAERKHASMAAAARNLWAEGGIRRFYKGFTPCLIRAVPANGAMLFTVDRVTTMLNQ
jgi:solute carrier family 25 carnitine/acylcarnitine transporter 20/29